MRLNCGEDNGVSLAGRTREVPPAPPASSIIWAFAGPSCGRYLPFIVTRVGGSIARISQIATRLVGNE